MSNTYDPLQALLAEQRAEDERRRRAYAQDVAAGYFMLAIVLMLIGVLLWFSWQLFAELGI